MSFGAPKAIRVDKLHRHHAAWDPERWADLWRLYRGGKLFAPKRFIRMRRHEPSDLYEERCARAYYIGYIGEIIDQFVANLFQQEPKTKCGSRGRQEFYDAFAKDCDRSGQDFNAFHRQRWVRALLHGRALTWVDLPALSREARASIGEEPTVDQLDEYGARRAYLIPLELHELIDVQRAGNASIQWATIHQCRAERGTPFAAPTHVRRWTILSSTSCAVYELREEMEYRDGRWVVQGGEDAWKKATASLVSDDSHPFGRVPIAELCLPEGICIGDKLEGPQRHIIELDNAIAWQQFMGLFAMPVIKTARDFKQAVGEAYHVKMEPGDSFEWTEPAGTAVKTSMEIRSQVMEEMFRISHQMAQAVKSTAQTAGRSGESKRRDQSPTQIVLEHLGELARDYQQTIYSLVSAGRQEKLEWEVEGFDEFDVESLETFLDNQGRLNLVQVHSPTFHRENEKAVVRKVMPDLSEETYRTIDAEIDSAEIAMPGDELRVPGAGANGDRDGTSAT